MTIKEFIEDLQRISEDKKELPLVIQCPNGNTVPPRIKVVYEYSTDIFLNTPKEMVITWE